MDCQQILTFCFIAAVVPVYVLAGECCKAHYDLTLSYNKEKWCDDYCCFQFAKYDCCSKLLLRAPSSEREDFCAAFFSDNEWAAALVALGCVALAVGGCVFICKVCCGSSRVTGTTISSGAAPGVTVVNSQNTMAMQQQQPTYPAYQTPNYPA
ncbi:uncharacterized protein LOC125649218 [Ostrea edulis]|uniref:uncharacterized protein LOC125649218 n=1 Tax=Ostrea edulis TaxID=37623 RepID=UPI002095BAEF|nr:uncharacterized protein LOC125649218 [Ostrea edulis]XP_056020880.1 uncharacterized protein LOC125649218 [Ostrea edulis]